MHKRNKLQLKEFYILLIATCFVLNCKTLFAQSNIWVGTWGCAPYAAGEHTPPSPYLANNTLRQVIRVSIGGDTLRVKFSNKTCATAVTMKAVNIAVATTVGGSTIDASTLTTLKFNGSESVTMEAYSEVTSDPVAFALEPGTQLAITTYYGNCETSSDMTFHYGSRTNSYILSGNQSTSADFSGATTVERWYHIANIDVIAPDSAGCVGVIGNSITDGYGLHGGLKNKWTDVFSQNLLDNETTKNVGVLNMGIGGTLITTSGLSRYQDDLLAQTGMRWIIIFYGTNDIAAGQTATNIIDAYKQIIDDAHEMNLKVYGATITPFKGSGHYSEAHEEVRQSVNEWIRTTGNFDACIDFDKGIRNPNDTIKMIDEYANDYLHPNVAGYAFLGNYVNPSLFTELIDMGMPYANAGTDKTVVDYDNAGSAEVTLNGSGSSDFGSELASFVWTENGTQIAIGETSTVTLTIGEHTITLTVTDSDGNTDTDEVVITVTNDAGVWLEAECGTVGSLFDINSDSNASNGKYVTVKSGNNSTSSAPSDASGFITYTFDVEEAGTYTLYARMITPTANDDSYWVKMDNSSYSMWNGMGTSTSWTWFGFSTTYTLSKGSHTLTIAYREDGAKLDKLLLTNGNSAPEGQGGNAGNCSSSLNEDVNDIDIKFFPNPIKDNMFLTIDYVPCIIDVFNINGEKMFRKYVDTKNVVIDMSGYQSGMYFLLINGNVNNMIKLMKS